MESKANSSASVISSSPSSVRGYDGKIDRFLVGRTVGYGGSCVVKSGIDTKDNKKVAIKLFKELNIDTFKLM